MRFNFLTMNLHHTYCQKSKLSSGSALVRSVVPRICISSSRVCCPNMVSLARKRQGPIRQRPKTWHPNSLWSQWFLQWQAKNHQLSDHQDWGIWSRPSKLSPSWKMLTQLTTSKFLWLVANTTINQATRQAANLEHINDKNVASP